MTDATQYKGKSAGHKESAVLGRAASPSPEAVPAKLILGIGATGLSVARFLARRGQSFAAADTRGHPALIEQFRTENKDVRLYLGDESEIDFDGIEQVIASPGIDPRHPWVERARQLGVEIVSDIDLFLAEVARLGHSVVGITGSNGKSTVVTMIGEMFRAARVNAAIGGNLGTPALDLLNYGWAEAFALELSSFQLQYMKPPALAVACVLNVSSDHLDRHGLMEAYAQTKASVYQGSKRQVFNLDDPLSRPPLIERGSSIAFADAGLAGTVDKSPKAAPADAVTTVYRGMTHRAELWLARGDQPLCTVSELSFSGAHNIANACAALAIGECWGLELEDMLVGLKRFRGLRHRNELVLRAGGVDWYDNSKGTNVGAAVASIHQARGPLVLIAEGHSKGADLTPLSEAMKSCGRAAVVFGADAENLEAALSPAVPVYRVSGMQEAIDLAENLASGEGSVLLSPACASSAPYENFAERGCDFTAKVRLRAKRGQS